MIPRSFLEALAILREESGKQFDPRGVEATLATPESWAELLDLARGQRGEVMITLEFADSASYT